MGRIIVIILNIYAIYLGFAWGAMAGAGWSEGKHDRWADPIREAYTHTVTIYWNEDMTDFSTIDVRQDQNWTITGSNGYRDLYTVSNPTNATTELSYALRGHIPAGKTEEDFAGLFLSPYGGTPYLNAAGYSLYNVKSDMVLYANWN